MIILRRRIIMRYIYDLFALFLIIINENKKWNADDTDKAELFIGKFFY
jgi:hypothetical protein